ncbi:type VII secretion protein EccCb [Nocardia fusca]|uniref:Type VII secretion protein EccCb n=1 Tax=Nocardia fusca TaxID=941183 RepID=A0ABV3F5T8_9NOCA
MRSSSRSTPCCAMTSPNGRRLALFVANDTYHFDGLPRLYAPISDAEQLRELLRDPEIGEFRPTELLVNESKAEIERSIERLFRGAEPEDVVLFYFSGHGLRTRQNLYLAAGNTDPQMPSSTAVSSAFIRELIRESAAAAKIIILDCCYSGAFLGTEVMKSVPTIDDVAQDLAAGDGICVLTASSGVETATERRGGDSAPLSEFTSALIKGIDTGLADRGSGKIGVHDLWVYASEEVRSRTQRQTPNHYGVFRDEVHIARVRRRYSTILEVGDRVQLGTLVGRLEQDSIGGLRAANWWGTGKLKVPVGQERRTDGVSGETVWLDLAAADRNLVIVGRAGSGKSTFLRTLAGSLALTHSSDEATLYVLESGNRLGSMSALPHIASAVGDDEPADVEAVLDRIAGEIRRRRSIYRKHSIDSPASLRAVRSTLAEPVPDIFLFIDRLEDFREHIAEFDRRVRNLASAGPEYAVHLVVTARDWTEVPGELADLFSAHIELRLNRPEGSRQHPERAARLPDGPGWALFRQRPFRIAMPDLRDLDPELLALSEITDGAAELVDRVRGHRQVLEVSDAQYPRVEADVDFAQLLGLVPGDDLDIAVRWQPRTGRDRLRVPIGVTATGNIVELDLKDAAEGGMGPHGLCIGATGSGKSELLRTLVLALLTTHSPDALNLVLVDFKGGTTFRGLDSLPHVSAVISNLEEELALIDRLKDALAGELNRRQELLRSAGRYGHAADYERARAAGAPLEPLPALFVVVDEFSELLTQKPDFAELFVMIGRLGRSLHVHLLLASQRLEDGKLRGLESHLSYRIGLRTFSANESRAVLGTPDAYQLPGIPGSGYLNAGTGELLRFKAAYVSGPERLTPGTDTGSFEQRSILDAVVARIPGHGAPSHQLWLPPLDDSPTVDMLLPDPDRSPPANRHAQVSIPIGVVDKPYEHRRDVLTVDLSGAQGNIAVVGGPQSGKSTTLHTIVMAAAARYTPEQAQFYCLDFGGGTMAGLAGIPHVGFVADRRDSDRVRRTIAALTTLLRQRSERFAELGIASIAEARRRNVAALEAGAPPAVDQCGDVFLVVDGWRTIRDEYELLESQITALAGQGLPVGIHVIISATRWAEIRPVMKDRFGTRLELRLGDPSDSDLDRRTAHQVPVGRPGRGITADRLHMLVALPRLDSDSDPGTVTDGMARGAEVLRGRYGDRRAPEVRMLPSHLPREQVLAAARDLGIRFGRTKVVVGLGESELQPVLLDFEAESHFMAFGDVGCGKTTLLRTIVAGITESNTPSDAALILVDFRRTLLGAVPPERLAAYATGAEGLKINMRDLADLLQSRLPGPQITPQELRERSWWRGPEIYLVVDDYDLVVTSGDNPLAPLLEYLPQARDVGMHLIVARRIGGVARALYDPILGALKNLAVETLIMSGSRDEGIVMGDVRPAKLPPGRGILVSRTREQEIVQTAQTPG